MPFTTRSEETFHTVSERPFLRSILKGQEMITCLKCGLELRKDEASFRVTPKSIDVEYLGMIDQIVESKLKVEAN